MKTSVLAKALAVTLLLLGYVTVAHARGDEYKTNCITSATLGQATILKVHGNTSVKGTTRTLTITFSVPIEFLCAKGDPSQSCCHMILNGFSFEDPVLVTSGTGTTKPTEVTITAEKENASCDGKVHRGIVKMTYHAEYANAAANQSISGKMDVSFIYPVGHFNVNVASEAGKNGKIKSKLILTNPELHKT